MIVYQDYNMILHKIISSNVCLMIIFTLLLPCLWPLAACPSFYLFLFVCLNLFFYTIWKDLLMKQCLFSSLLASIVQADTHHLLSWS